MKIEMFIDNYFKEIEEILISQTSFLNKTKKEVSEIDFIFLKKFIDTAVKFLFEIDDKILDGLNGKIYDEINYLYKIYKKYKKESSYPEVIYYKYLDKIDEYATLQKKYKDLREYLEISTKNINLLENKLKKIKEGTTEYKKLKGTYVDAVYEYSNIKKEFYETKEKLEYIEELNKKKFLRLFILKRDEIMPKFEKLLNIKIYYFEKLLWISASKSRDIVNYFTNSNIDIDFSTKTFIKYYLKHIDTEKTNQEFIDYLKKALLGLK
ncbi:hypothetical protein FE773_00635 [Caminibacter mediatlanticus TB-2]|uniref:Uncharacterized protein n=1 Tax=Caminibacter mediatlanticus TB-2 TaxID=391592 RepID=A0ABX5VA65_9BACT|nr:hypothetical protein [Caminibacter mediatlanticus]QCT93744.1 hypothetical protein FE773_00635 [Caminibacter mediatlanticus TB-2]